MARAIVGWRLHEAATWPYVPIRFAQGAVINLRQLRYFTRIVEAGSITQAANELYVAQPALGSQMRLLEAELGVNLLQRHSRGVRTTPTGDLLYRRALPILQDLESLRQEVMASGHGRRESLVLGVTPGIANVLGSGLLVQARDAVPTVHISLVEEMSYVLADAVMRADVDLALAYEVGDKPALRSTALLQEELVFVSKPSSPFSQCDEGGAAEITLAQAVSHPLVLADGRDPVRRLIEREAGRLACVFSVAYEASSISTMKNIILHGEAAGILPRGTVMAELRSGALRMRRIVKPTLCRRLYLIERAQRQPLQAESAVLAFINAMVDQFAREQGDLVHDLHRVAPG
ncbi:LysR family transcriptional regulator [Castellaniella sp. UC4442_H9]|nr:LysR substrate-binding domain-containing protein [Castellaniella sp.]